MSKKETVGTLKKKLWTIFSRYTRLRDAIRTTGTAYEVICITCPRKCETKYVDAGHGVSRGYSSTFVDERNVKAQCKRCNGYGSGEQYLFSKAVDKLHGEGTFEELEKLKHQSHKWSRPELRELIEEYTEKFNNLAEEYGNPWE